MRAVTLGTATPDRRKGIHIVGGDRINLTNFVLDRYRAGRSIREIARLSGRSYGFIHRLLSDAETPRRPRGGRHSSEYAIEANEQNSSQGEDLSPR